MKFEFKKASKKKSKLRCAIFGPSGSGKTYSSLMIASGLGNKIAVIDTERGSASKYAAKLDFDVIDLIDPSIESYIGAIQAANRLGYEVLILDSLSHVWYSLLEEINRLAKSKFNGNTWSAWSEGTPRQKKLVDTLLSFEGHIIATMRSKTEWTQETYMDKEGRTKNKPTRIGLSPEQGKGIEYEFDLLLEMAPNHYAEVIKDRTEKFQDTSIEKPGKEFGHQLLDWLNEGEEYIQTKIIKNEYAKRLQELIEILKIPSASVQEGLKMKNVSSLEELTEDQAKRWVGSLEERVKTLNAKSPAKNDLNSEDIGNA